MPLPLATVVREGLEEQEVSSSRDLTQAASGASLAAHTPGPWRADGNTNGNFYGVSAVREGFRGSPVVVWRGIARPSSAEGRANAHLIAAAPELLATLAELTEAVDFGSDSSATHQALLDRARAAIAKASPQSLKQEG